MPKVVLEGYILVPEPDLPAVQQALPVHIALTREEPGCLIFEVTQDDQLPTRYDVYEEFVDDAAFEHHQQRVSESDWGRATQAVERHYEIRRK